MEENKIDTNINNIDSSSTATILNAGSDGTIAKFGAYQIATGLFSDVHDIQQKIEQMEEEHKLFKEDVSKIKQSENRLLNRFGWTLILANIFIGVLTCLIIFFSLKYVFPKFDEWLKNDNWIIYVIEVALTAILGFIVKLYWEVSQFAKYVKKRDQENNQ